MKVLVLTTIMAPYRTNLFNELGKYCDLTVCFEQKNEQSRNKNWFAESSQYFESIPLKHWDKKVDRIKFDIFNQFKKKKYDLAIAYEYSTITAILFMAICRLKKIPYLINMDGNFTNSHPLKYILKKILISGASGCLAGGEYAKNYFIYYGALEENIYLHHFTSLYANDILASPLGDQEKRVICKKLQLQHFSKVVITVGRFIKSKRIDVLIAAWKHMPDDWVLLIVGEGDLEDEYKNQIETLGLKNIKFTGHLDFKTLRQYYLASDLFVLPTELDVWGLVVNEALASGLPVITTDKCIAGLELIVNEFNGFIVPVDAPEQLSKKIKEVLLDERKASMFSLNALKSISNYTYESVAQSHMVALTTIIERDCQSIK